MIKTIRRWIKCIDYLLIGVGLFFSVSLLLHGKPIPPMKHFILMIVGAVVSFIFTSYYMSRKHKFNGKEEKPVGEEERDPRIYDND